MRLFLTLLASLTALADPISDGPYVFHQADRIEAAWVCADAVQRLPLPASRNLASPCTQQPGVQLKAELSIAEDAYPQPKRWAALSDIHGQAGVFAELLKAQGVIDGQGRWAFGDGVLVIAGDVFDRGPTVTEALWMIYRLEQEAKAAGGALHFVLGNHEAIVLRGDDRYVHPKYLQSAKLLERSYAQLFGSDTELGRWLRTRATVIKLGDTVFMHGGLHPELAHKHIDLPAINAKFRQRLGASKDELAQDAEAQYLFGKDGPIWYRGYFLPQRATMAEVDALLGRLSAQRIVVGHTTQKHITSLYRGRIIGIDAGMKKGKSGELLLWQDGQLQRGLLDGSRVSLPAGEDEGLREQDSE